MSQPDLRRQDRSYPRLDCSRLDQPGIDLRVDFATYMSLGEVSKAEPGLGLRVPLRQDLSSIMGYRPGRSSRDAEADLTGAPIAKRSACRLASNELPFDPLPSVRDVLAEAISQAHRYLDFFSRSLVSALARHLEVGEDQVVVDAGSSPLCRYPVEMVAEPGDEVILPQPSFEVYERAAFLARALPVAVPLANGVDHDLERMLDAVTPRTRAVYLCNPNNPTSTGIDAEDVKRFVAEMPDRVLIILDEAYREFASDQRSAPDAVAILADHPNVVVLRTFSKAYGLAGLKVGYGVAHPELADAMRKLVPPFAVSSLAQAGAVASLAAESEIAERVAAVVAERERVLRVLERICTGVARSSANFCWLPLGAASASFAASCEERGIYVRPFPGLGVRVTVGSPADNDRFPEAAEELLGEEAWV